MKASYEELRTVKQLVDETPWLTMGKLRFYLLHRETNGLVNAVVKISREVLIDRVEFARWVESHRLSNSQ